MEPEDGFFVLFRKYLMLWPAGLASRAEPVPVGQGTGPELRGQGKADRKTRGFQRSSHNSLQPEFCRPPCVSICGMGPVLGNVCGHSPRSSVDYLSTMSQHTVLSLFLYREKVLSEVNLWSYMSPMLRFHSRQPWQHLASQVGQSPLSTWLSWPPVLGAGWRLRVDPTCIFRGDSETKLKRGRVALGERTFIVNLEVKENQGPVF